MAPSLGNTRIKSRFVGREHVFAFTTSAGAAVLLPKDALRVALVPGAEVAVTDRSDASATLLWDVVGDGWSAAATTATRR